jgi:deoxyribodipyrimidine photo-lyase
MFDRSIFWFRRDLRLVDNRGLSAACENSRSVVPVFIFDTSILNKINNKNDKRVYFIYECLREIKNELNKLSSNIIVLYGDPCIEIPKLAKLIGANALFTNKDYEPYAIQRDFSIKNELEKIKISFHSFKDQVIFEEREILTQAGEPYKVFTPYKNAWIKASKQENFLNCKINFDKLKITNENSSIDFNFPSIEEIGFTKTDLILPTGRLGALNLLNNFSSKLNNYDESRNFINKEGTSKISIHLRFGTVSIRELFRYANSNSKGADVWRSELIWREFYQMILSQFPHVAKSCFKEEYNSIVWTGKEEHFNKWVKGQTGYPIIDAAMRYFAISGWMHNRLRMIVASFLTKDLLINYKKGEEYFAQNLLDFDLAANNGGWQWSASTGCDAQPYFRVFNPETQSKKFDPTGEFIKKHCPELRHFPEKYIHAPHKSELSIQKSANCIIGVHYPHPIVEHENQRLQAIQMFK